MKLCNRVVRMPGSVKLRFVLPALLAAFVAVLVAGCGGGGSEGGGDPASLAPAKAPVFIDFKVRPEGEMKTNIDALAKKIAGIDSLGGLIVSELEKSSSEKGEEFDYEKEVEPWLGEEGGLFLREYEEGNFEGVGAALQTEDEGEAREFVEKQEKAKEEAPREGSYEGVDFYVEAEDGTTIGVFDGFIALAKDEANFKAMIDASNGESLADESGFTDAIANVPSGSAADVYVDIAGLIRESGSEVDPNAKAVFENAGINLNEATAVASLVPHSEQIELDVSSNAAGENPPSGDASAMLGSLPKSSVAAFASAEFGKRFNEGIDKLDEQGIPGQVPPHKLKKALKQAGIDLESIASSIGDAGFFLTGNSRSSLGGAAVFTTENAQQAKNTVSDLGLFLRGIETSGVTAIGGKASGFSIRSAELGSQPIVVVAKGSRIAIGYGRVPALAALQENGETLAESPAYKEAESALGGTPISGFVDGPSALKLASALIPSGDEGFREAKKYLTKIDYLALGSEASGNLAVAKLIVGVGK